MTHSPNISEAGLNGLHDHQIAQSRALAELEMLTWYATDILLEADAIFRKYGLQHVPSDEARGLLDAVRDYLLRVPPIDADAHNHPLPERPPTPTGGGGVGEDPAPSVGTNHAPVLAPAVDIHLDDDISHAFDDLKTTDNIDGDEAA